MDNDGLIGVVTVTYNSACVIADFMDSLLKQSHRDFILYVVDNASSDESLKLISKYKDSRIVLIANETNVGVAEGNNIGIRAALHDGCTSVLLLNNDTAFESDLFAKLHSALGAHRCAMVAPKILQFDDRETIWYAGGCLSKIRASIIHFGEGQKDRGQFDTACFVTYSPTCCLLIKKEIFKSVGMMDEIYFVYCDDADFCNRSSRMGVKLFYLPTAKLLHKVSSLTQKQSAFTLLYGTRNRIYYLWKNFSFIQFIAYLPIFQLHYFFKFIVRDRNPANYGLALRAFWQGLKLSTSADARQKKKREMSMESAKAKRLVLNPNFDSDCESVPR